MKVHLWWTIFFEICLIFFLFAIEVEVEIMVCWFHWNLKFALENSKIQNNQTQIFPEIFIFAEFFTEFESENSWIYEERTKLFYFSWNLHSNIKLELKDQDSCIQKTNESKNRREQI